MEEEQSTRVRGGGGGRRSMRAHDRAGTPAAAAPRKHKSRHHSREHGEEASRKRPAAATPASFRKAPASVDEEAAEHAAAADARAADAEDAAAPPSATSRILSSVLHMFTGSGSSSAAAASTGVIALPPSLTGQQRRASAVAGAAPSRGASGRAAPPSARLPPPHVRTTERGAARHADGLAAAQGIVSHQATDGPTDLERAALKRFVEMHLESVSLKRRTEEETEERKKLREEQRAIRHALVRHLEEEVHSEVLVLLAPPVGCAAQPEDVPVYVRLKPCSQDAPIKAEHVAAAFDALCGADLPEAERRLRARFSKKPLSAADILMEAILGHVRALIRKTGNSVEVTASKRRGLDEAAVKEASIAVNTRAWRLHEITKFITETDKETRRKTRWIDEQMTEKPMAALHTDENGDMARLVQAAAAAARLPPDDAEAFVEGLTLERVVQGYVGRRADVSYVRVVLGKDAFRVRSFLAKKKVKVGVTQLGALLKDIVVPSLVRGGASTTLADVAAALGPPAVRAELKGRVLAALAALPPVTKSVISVRRVPTKRVIN